MLFIICLKFFKFYIIKLLLGKNYIYYFKQNKLYIYNKICKGLTHERN